MRNQVGGSTGQVSALLATHHPSLHFTVQDLPDTVANGPAALSTLSHDIASRITFAPHDFFTAQPLSADLYFLRKILHDWSSEQAKSILQHLATAMKSRPGARLVVMDTILPRPGELAPVQEAMLRVRDLTMAQSFNSKERALGEWEELFGSTKPKLSMKSWKQPLGSAMAVMEVVVAGEEDEVLQNDVIE
jgi:6-hydroxytryprostatin B O-methyltransferase